MPKKAHKELFPTRLPFAVSPASTVGRWAECALRSNYCLFVELRHPVAKHEWSLQYLLERESKGKARPDIMRRIITRLATLERNRLYKLLNIKK